MDDHSTLADDLRDNRRRALAAGCGAGSLAAVIGLVTTAGDPTTMDCTRLSWFGMALVFGVFAVALAAEWVVQEVGERGALLAAALLGALDLVGRTVAPVPLDIGEWLLAWMSYVVLIQVAAHVVWSRSGSAWRTWAPLLAAYALAGTALRPGQLVDEAAAIVVPLIGATLLEALQRTIVMVSRSEAAARAEAEIGRTDLLTGLWNRRGVVPVLEDLVAGDVVMLADIDHFKGVNDAHGHDVGDHVLRRVAQTLAGGLRRDDAVGRWGGEEFVVAVRGGDAGRLAERLRAAVAEHPGRPRVTISVGVASVAPDGDWQDAVRRADLSLYMAKEQGRDRVVVDATPLRAAGPADDLVRIVETDEAGTPPRAE